ncbi:hypothetical protein BaRGS_00034025, partial [Batillaria attramentaria]
MRRCIQSTSALPTTSRATPAIPSLQSSHIRLSPIATPEALPARATVTDCSVMPDNPRKVIHV